MIPARASLAHLNVLLKEIESVTPEGETALSASVESAAHTSKKRSLYLLVSDLFDDQEKVMKAVQLLRYKKNEVWVVHLLDPDEISFPYSGTVRFESMENSRFIEMETGPYRAEYQAAVREFVDSYRRTLRNYGVKYLFYPTTEPFDRILRTLLSPESGAPADMSQSASK